MSLILSGTDGLSDVDGSAATPAIRGTDANTGIFFPAADTIAFSEGGAEAARFDSSGNFGIGTTSIPSYTRLQVTGTAGAQTDAKQQITISAPTTTVGEGAGIRFNAASGAKEAVGVIGVVNNASGNLGSMTFGVYNGGATVPEYMRLDNSGNLGIGTTTPDALLHAYKTSGKVATFGNNVNNNGNYIVLGGTVSNKNWVLSSNMIVGGEFGIGRTSANGGTTIGSAHDLMIDTSGNLLLGTTTNANGSRVRVSSSNPSSGYNLELQQTSTNGGVYYYQAFFAGSTQTGNINSNGTTTTYATTSDYRLKNTVTPMTGALAKVAALKPVTYKWNTNGSDGEGFIAHELQEVFPDAVVGKKDDLETYIDDEGNKQTRPKYQSIDTSFLVATLTAAIQEQQALITTLTDRITALENK